MCSSDLAETEAEPETQNPFTPDGTGTVVDNATDADGKGMERMKKIQNCYLRQWMFFQIWMNCR